MARTSPKIVRENPYFEMQLHEGMQRGSRSFSEFVIFKKTSAGLVEVERRSAGGEPSEVRANALFDKLSAAAAKRVQKAIPSYELTLAPLA